MQPSPPFGPNQPFGYVQGASPYRQTFAPAGAVAGPPVGPGLKKIKLVLGIGQLLCLFAFVGLLTGAVIAGNGHERDLAQLLIILGFGAMAIWNCLIIGYAIANALWIYKFWSWIPPEHRWASLWKKYISPGTAVGFLFIPYFNLFWMFVVYLGMADIMERLRGSYPCSKGPAKTLAILALVIPLVFFPAGPIFQYLLAKHLEAMANEMYPKMIAPQQGPMTANAT